ncbi:ROK family protein [Salinibacterium sp. SYSU T00001]|uniref:ROK family transcriptional regulator n=1 Tax=Homoserinimonas sedimenticola TaxID=2986805 RepID=UPI002235F8B3|nr:ROK family transcriptional regulator [Salinibacterium sedimenticola]MCW4385260.1 ROK family protein [Salinibacterium sedimenticola]
MPHANPAPSPALGSPGGILSFVRSGRATSRAEIARATRLSPTTVAAKVQLLIDAGYLREAGDGASQGGRRPRQLEVDPRGGLVTGVDLGARHASFGLFDLRAELIAEKHLDIDIAKGPDEILPWVVEVAQGLAREHSRDGQRLIGVGLGLPGPVSKPQGRLVSPSRMPGWDGLDAAAELERLTGEPAVVDNDANLMALGEHISRGEDVDDFVFIKAGSSIGGGVIVGGRLHHGHHGMAGDISHVTVHDAPATPCSCGRNGCLDAVAGGDAIVASLRAENVDVSDTPAVIALARNGHPLATQMLREAGIRTGTVLATVVNFSNPQRIVLGGALSEAAAFVGGVRSAIYTECLPLATEGLEIEASQTKNRGGVIGAARVVLDHILDPETVTQRVAP